MSLGRTQLRVTRLVFGGASIGGLFRPVDPLEAAAVLDHAWDLGIRGFDTAPLYGYGASEQRVGALLSAKPRAEYVLSTKVGRLVVPADDIPDGALLDRQELDGRHDAFYADTAARRIVLDYSADGVRRSLEASLDRLGVGRIDVAFIHDPDDHWTEAVDGAYPALHELRAQGILGAIGVGMNQAPMLARFVETTDIDVVLLANRYTLLDQRALDDLLPRCAERGVAVLLGGVMNSGLLADPGPESRFDYRPAPPSLIERARRIGDVCARHGVALRTAAIRFPMAHPAVTALVTGVRTREHLDEYPAALRTHVPAALWDELRTEGLLRPDAPVPAEAPT